MKAWGPWRLEGRWLAAYNGDGALLYEVPLERAPANAARLLAVIAGKSWATPTVLGWLVRALVDQGELEAT